MGRTTWCDAGNIYVRPYTGPGGCDLELPGLARGGVGEFLLVVEFFVQHYYAERYLYDLLFTHCYSNDAALHFERWLLLLMCFGLIHDGLEWDGLGRDWSTSRNVWPHDGPDPDL